MHRHHRLIGAAIVLLLVCTGITFADSLRYVPLDDPVYDFLEYARVAGRLDSLPRIRPYSQGDVTQMLGEVLESASDSSDEWVSARAGEHLARMDGPRQSVVTGHFGEEGTVTVDAGVSLTTDVALNRLRDTIPTFTTPFTLAIGLADDVHISLDVTPAFAYWAWYAQPYRRYDPQLLSDYYTYTYWFDTDTGSFNHSGFHEPGRPSFRIMFETLNQFSVDLDYLRLHAGRQALDWGPSNVSNLLLSGTAKPYDHLGFTMPLGSSGTFSWMTGILQDFAWESGPMEERLLTAHRVGYQITDWLYLAIYESVIYDLSFELAYLNPLSFYYVTEVTQGSDDNKLGGADVIVNLPNVEFYGSFFADDWDAGRLLSLNSSHNEWAGIMGARTAGLFLPGLALNLELVYLSHWMYTHFTWVDASNVGKSYQHYGTPVGHYLGPNSWMAHLSGRYDFTAGTWGETAVRLIQDGRGDINTPPNWTEEAALHEVTDYRDIYYTFLDRGKPGFTVDTTLDWTLSGHHDFPGVGLSLEVDYTVQYSFSQATEDMSRIAGSELLDHYLSLQANWSPGALLRVPE
ncbi:MAG: hypothetical protein KOO61_02225 [Spirochaetales bacterium]|nr:hypothetical protein [Spirochaetales bacterium]